jgi:hypothetical protein
MFTFLNKSKPNDHQQNIIFDSNYIFVHLFSVVLIKKFTLINGKNRDQAS